MSLLEKIGEALILTPLEAVAHALEKANDKWDEFEENVNKWEDRLVEKVGKKIDDIDEYIYGEDNSKEHANALERNLFEDVVRPGVDKVLEGIVSVAEKLDPYFGSVEKLKQEAVETVELPVAEDVVEEGGLSCEQNVL